MTKISNLSALCFEAEEKQQIEEEINLEIDEILSSFENQDEEEIIDE